MRARRVTARLLSLFCVLRQRDEAFAPLAAPPRRSPRLAGGT